ncbi:MAG: OmpA family protein [Verrucomicrobiota bacterium]|nr:OmpA family protein [Verrucomicrobiota bacterium]
MKASPPLRRLVSISACLILAATPLGLGQGTSDKTLEKREADLERQRLDLEKKTLDLQRKELELEKARQQLQEQQSGRSLSMNLSGDVLFDYDKATLKPEAEAALKKVGVVLSQFPESMVTVEGYTDAKGGKSVNVPLSRERATAVKDWLVKNGNVPAASIIGKGFGEENPVAPNTNSDGSDNPGGRALNRRVSIIVEKPASATPAMSP